MKKKPIIKIYGNDYNTLDGTAIRDYIHVSDLAEIHEKILKKMSVIKEGMSVSEVITEAYQ